MTIKDHIKENIIEINFNEIQLQRINLEPGDTLLVKLVGDNMMNLPEDKIKELNHLLVETFDKNPIIILKVPKDNQIEFQAIIQAPTESACGSQSYCADCSCGKKEAAESK